MTGAACPSSSPTTPRRRPAPCCGPPGSTPPQAGPRCTMPARTRGCRASPACSSTTPAPASSPPGRPRRLLEAIDRAADFTGPFRTAQVLAADEDTVTFAALPGRLLHDGLPVTDGTWRRAWRETLDAWTTAVEASRRRFQDGASSSVGATGATGEGAAGTGIGHV